MASLLTMLRPKFHYEIEEEDLNGIETFKDVTNKIFELCSTLLVIYLMLVSAPHPSCNLPQVIIQGTRSHTRRNLAAPPNACRYRSTHLSAPSFPPPSALIPKQLLRTLICRKCTPSPTPATTSNVSKATWKGTTDTLRQHSLQLAW